MKKRLFILLTVICMLFSNYIGIKANGNTLNDTEQAIAEQIEDMIFVNYSNIQGQYELGQPLTICNVDANSLYYLIPVYRNLSRIATVGLNSNGNINLWHDTQIYDRVMEHIFNDCIIYTSVGVVYAGYNYSVIELYNGGYNLAINTEFNNLSFQEKMAYVQTLIANVCMNFNVSNVINNVEVINIALPYSQPLSVTPIIESNVLGITKFIAQNGYNLCWAACVATIANYKQNMNLTAEDVATAMNHNYFPVTYPGGTIENMIDALELYSLYYSDVDSKLSWTSVKSNINSSYPFIVLLHSTSGNHAVTGYGYNCRYGDSEANSNSRYINIWEPNGNKLTIQYNASTYSFIGEVWTWTKTIKH